MSKKNKLISLKLLPRSDFTMQHRETQPVFPFSVKGIVEGKTMIFKGSMKVIREKKVEFTFEELDICLDDWFDECQEALKNALINQLSKQRANR
jgi:hypothetical protein